MDQRPQGPERIADGGHAIDFQPVAKPLTPDLGATRLPAAIDPEDAEIAPGLCDLDVGCIEIGSVRTTELAALQGDLGLPVERDLRFTAKKGFPDTPAGPTASGASARDVRRHDH